MRFTGIALAGLLQPLLGATSKELSYQAINARLQSGKVDLNKVLERSLANKANNAVSNNWFAQYQQQQVDAYGFHVTSNYNVQFNSCVSLKVEDDEILQDGVLQLAQQGRVVAQQSFAIVKACQSRNCETDSTAVELLVPLEIFVSGLIDYFPNKKEAYCAACENHYNYCLYGNGQKFDNTSKYSNNGEFWYNDQHYKLIECSKCRTMGCFTQAAQAVAQQQAQQNGGQQQQNNNNNGDDAVWNEAVDWVLELAECKDTGVQWEPQGTQFELYGGLICNAAGNGVEIGVFLDEECRLYTNAKSYGALMQQSDYEYYYKSQDIIESLFTSQIECFNDDDIIYVNAYQPVYTSDGLSGCQMNYFGGYNDQTCMKTMLSNYGMTGCTMDAYGVFENADCQAKWLEAWNMNADCEIGADGVYTTQDCQTAWEEAFISRWDETHPTTDTNQYCDDVFNSGYSRPLSNCSNVYKDGAQAAAAANQDGQYYENEGQNSSSSSSYGSQADSTWSSYGLYQYQLSKENVYNGAAVCDVVVKTYDTGAVTTVYNQSGSGTLFEYSNTTVSNFKNGVLKHFKKATAHSLTTSAIAGIAMLVACSVFVGVLAVRRVHRVLTRKTEIVEVEKEPEVATEEKRIPLIL